MLYPDLYPTLDQLISRNTVLDVQLLPEDVLLKFYDTLILHISCVQEAGVKLGVFKEQLEIHDMSKFYPPEFNAYARHFQGGGAPQEFALAWLHHLHFNEHHPEYWRFPGDFNPKGTDVVKGCLPMPHRFLLEHIADLIGASKAYTGSDDMTDWLSKNMRRMYYHPQTADALREELSKIGYADIVGVNKFGHETCN